MNKKFLNKYCRKFGFEVHGTGYLQSVKKTSFKEDTFSRQNEILNGECSVIFDIGANRGQTTLNYIELFPTSRIFAFEPFPESFNIYKSRFSKHKNVFSFQKAVGEQDGKRVLFVNKNVDTNSLLKPTKIGLSSDQQVANLSKLEVDVWTINDFCKNNEIDHIDILKLDVQGSELGVLKGASKLLAEKRIKLIYSEAYFKKQYESQPLFHDISKYLEQYDYQIQDIYNPIYGNNFLVWCDVIFLPNK